VINDLAMNRHDQKGAALAVSLILLLVMTIIGIAAMDGARLEISMAGLMRQAEVALRRAERTMYPVLTGAQLTVQRGRYPRTMARMMMTLWWWNTSAPRSLRASLRLRQQILRLPVAWRTPIV